MTTATRVQIRQVAALARTKRDRFTEACCDLALEGEVAMAQYRDGLTAEQCDRLGDMSPGDALEVVASELRSELGIE